MNSISIYIIVFVLLLAVVATCIRVVQGAEDPSYPDWTNPEIEWPVYEPPPPPDWYYKYEDGEWKRCYKGDSFEWCR